MLKEWLEPLRFSRNRLARELFVRPAQVNDIVKGKRRISPDMALRLGRYFGNSARFWLNMRQHHDLALAMKKNGKEIERRVVPHLPGEPASARGARSRC